MLALKLAVDGVSLRVEDRGHLYESHNNGLFYFYEEWESQDALDCHTKTSHYKQLTQNVRDLLEGVFEVNILDSLG